MLKKLYLFLILINVILLADANYSSTKNDRSFFPVFQKTTRGYLTVIGNQVLCAKKNGQCIEPGKYKTNNSVYQDYVNVDSEAVKAGYINSSSATLSLKPGDRIIWAGLYWQGRIFTSNPKKNKMVKNANTIYFKTPDTNGYVAIDGLTEKFNWYYDSNDNVWDYAAMADVTDIVKKSGQYFVANLQTSTGYNLGAGWALAIVVENDADKLMNINVYDGYKGIYNYHNNIYDKSIQVHLTGFYTPRYGDVSGSFILFGNESDRGLRESFSLTKKDGSTVLLHNRLNPENNVLNGTISKNGHNVTTRNPHYSNTLGTDIDEFDIKNYLDNGQTETTITLTSKGDRLFFAMFGISLEVYQPKICYMEELYDSNGTKVDKNSNIRVGDILTARLYIKNDDNENAENVEIKKFFDSNLTDYVPNSTFVKDVDWNVLLHIPDGGTHESVSVDYDQNTSTLRIGYLGSGTPPTFHPFDESNEIAQVEYNFTVTSDNPIQLKYDTSYKFIIAGKEYNVNGPLPKCTDFNNTITPYRPPLGSFNVVNSSFSGNIDPTDPNQPLNALKTAVVNDDYSFKVLHLDNDLQHLTPMSGVVFLDVVDATNIDETQQSCENAPLIYKLSGKTDYIDFGLNNASKSSIVSKTSKIAKIAKNATFRVRYIDWPTVLSEKHIPCINVSSKNGNLKGVPQCLNSVYKINQAFPGTPCIHSSTGAPCNPSNNGVGNPPYDHRYGCIQCLTDFHPSFACARDNFAIRPYGFVTFADNYHKRAGEDINITIKAVDEGNFTLSSGNKNAVLGLMDYNESISSLDLNATIYTPTTAEIQQMNQDVYRTRSNDASKVAFCPSTGTFTVNPATFRDGEVNATAKFSETGVITLKVQEKPGHEFALVDADDTPDSQRYITPSTTITDPTDISKDNLMVFIPYQITTTASSSTTNSKNWLYMSNDVNNSYQNGRTPSMAAYVSYTIEAQNKAGNRVQNFTKTCFPDTNDHAPTKNGLKLNSTFDLFLDLWIRPDRNATLNFYTEDNTSNAIWVKTPAALLEKDKNNTIDEWISPLQFENGKGEAKVYFNIERNSSKPVDPISITIVDANTSTSWMNNIGATNIFNGSNINTTYNFYYARLHIPTQGIEGPQGDIKAYYEIYTTGSDPAGIKGNESLDDVDWYINIAHSSIDGNITTATSAAIDPKINLLQKHSINSGEENLTMRYTSNIYPYAKTFGLDTQSWLLFDKYDPAIAKAKGRIIFNQPGGWLGRGDRNTTGDSELAPPKNENSRILW